MPSLRIVLLALSAAVVYGILHDQVTARICLEYFTIGHPPVFPTQSPTLLALGWGIIATWWVGLPLGLLLALAARAGSLPKLSARDLNRPVLYLLATMAFSAVIVGGLFYYLARVHTIHLWPPLDTLVAAPAREAFLADVGAHLASYVVGTLGGLVLAWWTWRERRCRAL